MILINSNSHTSNFVLNSHSKFSFVLFFFLLLGIQIYAHFLFIFFIQLMSVFIASQHSLLIWDFLFSNCFCFQVFLFHNLFIFSKFLLFLFFLFFFGQKINLFLVIFCFNKEIEGRGGGVGEVGR